MDSIDTKSFEAIRASTASGQHHPNGTPTGTRGIIRAIVAAYCLWRLVVYAIRLDNEAWDRSEDV